MLLALGLAVVVKATLVQAFYIPSPSMEPGFVANDRILVQKVSYWGDGTPQRGDIVVFKDPGGWLEEGDAEPLSAFGSALTKVGLAPTGGHLVKRVIGVEGDVIECCDSQGRLQVNGVPIDEGDYLADDPDAACHGPMIGCHWKAGPVPEGSLFVMGDNRNQSADSSFHLERPDESAYIDADLVVGKVVLLMWPFDHAHLIHRPDDFADVPEADRGADR